ncbi:MAG TPA: lamin tail domain-containing protein [Nannocystis sp.]|jgi:hypothetical protein
MSLRFAPLSLSLLLLTIACGDAGSQTTADTPATGSDSSGDTPTTDATTPTTGSSGEQGECGDGKLDAGEVCDGADLGGKQCADLDFLAGTLACAGDCGSFDVSGCEQDPSAALVVLNEVSAKGASEGPYADKGDAIELYNAGGATAELAGWKLSDDPTFPIEKTYVFPPGSSLAPEAYLVLVVYDEVTMTGDLPFGISTTKEETITLTNAADEMADQLIVQGADATVSYCRVPDGTGAWQGCDLTLGGPNLSASQTCGDGKIDGTEVCDGAALDGATCQSLGFTGGTLACAGTCTLDASMCDSGSEVAINELEATDDQIEIHNAGGAAVDISGWILTDDEVDANYDPAADPERLVFPDASSLAAKEFLVVAKGMLAGQHPFGLGATGDTVTLLDADLKVISQVTYADGQAATSFCRTPDGPTGMWAADCVPTLGSANMK